MKNSAKELKSVVMSGKELSSKEMKRLNKALAKASHTLGQSVKSLQGMPYFALEDGKTKVKTSEYAKRLGVECGKFTPKSVQAAWSDDMKTDEGRMAMYVDYGLYTTTDKHEAVYVLVVDKDGNEDYRRLQVRLLVEVGDNSWSSDVVLEGLKQSRHAEEEHKAAVDSVKAALEVGHYFVKKRINVGVKGAPEFKDSWVAIKPELVEIING